MRQLLSSSFRNRLFAALLAASLIPPAAVLRSDAADLPPADGGPGPGGGGRLSGQCGADLGADLSLPSPPPRPPWSGMRCSPRLSFRAAPSQGEVYRLFLEDVQSAQTLARLDLYDSRGSWYCSTRSTAGQGLSPPVGGVV